MQSQAKKTGVLTPVAVGKKYVNLNQELIIVTCSTIVSGERSLWVMAWITTSFNVTL